MSKELAASVCINRLNISLIMAGPVRGIRFDTVCRIGGELNGQPGELSDFEPGTDPAP
jgi:DNA-binding Xre family transcriptional regulator